MNYWLVKSKFGIDRTELFIQNDFWKNFDNKHFDIVNRVKEGDILLLGDDSLITHYAICIENENDGVHISVDEWVRFQQPINFATKKVYSKIIVKINDNELIDKIQLAIKKQKDIDSIILKSIKLKNFTLFRNHKLEFSSGINVIIGENGTGKTQLIKLLYVLIESNNEMIKHQELSKEPFLMSYKIKEKLKSTLRPEQIENLISRGEEESNIYFNLEKYWIDFHLLSSETHVSTVGATKKYFYKKAIFLPAKEILSFYTGFRSIYNQTSFDITFDDLANNLGRIVPQNSYYEKFEEKILKDLEEILGGKIILEQDRFYLLEEDGNKREITLVAEGARKLGTIFHLFYRKR